MWIPPKKITEYTHNIIMHSAATSHWSHLKCARGFLSRPFSRAPPFVCGAAVQQSYNINGVKRRTTARRVCVCVYELFNFPLASGEHRLQTGWVFVKEDEEEAKKAAAEKKNEKRRGKKNRLNNIIT